MSTPTVINKVISWDKNSNTDGTLHLISEEPLSIRIQGKAYSVIMRTPGEEIEHVAGFCLAEGIVDTTDELKPFLFANKKTPM
jgi:FdhD protein